MKVKSFRAPRIIIATVAQARAILRGIGFLLRRIKILSLSIFAAALVVGLLVWPHDQRLLEKLHFWRGSREDAAQSLAYFLGTWGDYPTYNVPLALLIWLYGVWNKSAAWRRAAVICFLGATLAGLFNDCFRLTIGRPRPDTHLPDGFYGIAYALKGGFQSFPSGHAASTFGAAVALLLTDLPLGLLTTLFALAVVWARMELYRHYPSDIAVGSIIGIYFGLLTGFGARTSFQNRPGP